MMAHIIVYGGLFILLAAAVTGAISQLFAAITRHRHWR